MTFYGPQSCSVPACKGSKLPKFQTPSPTCTLGPRPLPQQAPQGQATAMAFYGLSKLAFLGFQSCRLPARKPSKTLQTLQTLFHGPQSCSLPACKGSKLPKFQTPSPTNTVPSRHLRSTAMTFYGPQSCRLPACKGSKLPKFQTPSPTCTLGPRQLPQQAPQGQATAMAFLGFQSCRLPARKPSKTLQNSPNPPNAPNPPKPAKPSKHRPQQAPQIHSNDFLDKPAFKAALTGGQGHSNDFLWASKLQFGGPGPQQ